MDVLKRLNLMADRSYVVDDVLIVDDIGNESGNDQVVPLIKRYDLHGFSISEPELYTLRHENNPISGSVLSAHLACLVQAYITDNASQRHPDDTKTCLAFNSSFPWYLTSGRKRTRLLDRVHHSLGQLTLPPITSDQFREIESKNLALVFAPILVQLSHNDMPSWALLVFCFERQICFYCCDEQGVTHNQEHPARHAFVSIMECFHEIWKIDTCAWSLGDIVSPPPHENLWGPHVHCAFSCGINVLQVAHFLLRKFRRVRNVRCCPPIEVGYPPVCVCDTYRNVLAKTLMACALPEAFS